MATRAPLFVFRYAKVYDQQLAALAQVTASYHKRSQRVQAFIDGFAQGKQLTTCMLRMARLLNTTWPQPVIIYVLPNFFGHPIPLAITDPLTIALSYPKNGKLYVVSEEKLFLLLIYELAQLLQQKCRFKEYTSSLDVVQDHMITYALLQAVLPASLFARQKRLAKKDPQHKKAMNMMLKRGHHRVLCEVVSSARLCPGP